MSNVATTHEAVVEAPAVEETSEVTTVTEEPKKLNSKERKAKKKAERAAREAAAKAEKAVETPTDKASSQEAVAEAPKPAEGEKKPINRLVDRDRFGARIGTTLSRVNAMIPSDGDPITMKVIKKEIGKSQTYYNHMSFLLAKGYVVKVGNGWKVAPTKDAPVAETKTKEVVSAS